MASIRTLIDPKQLDAKVRELGEKITREHRGHELVLVPVLKGSFIFAADLARAIDLPLTIDFFGCRSYGAGTESSGVVQITHDLTKPIDGKHVIVVEDIVDTGLTLKYLLENLETRKPASLEICALLHKPARTRVAVQIDHLGFTIDDVFAIGYGLDFDEKYRNLPYIGVLEPE